jgi:hypothetical protein
MGRRCGSESHSRLKLSEKETRLHPGLGGKGRGLDLSPQPNERLVVWAHSLGVYVRTDILSRERRGCVS